MGVQDETSPSQSEVEQLRAALEAERFQNQALRKEVENLREEVCSTRGSGVASASATSTVSGPFHPPAAAPGIGSAHERSAFSGNSIPTVPAWAAPHRQQPAHDAHEEFQEPELRSSSEVRRFSHSPSPHKRGASPFL